jgi:hypothetical protein
MSVFTHCKVICVRFHQDEEESRVEKVFPLDDYMLLENLLRLNQNDGTKTLDTVNRLRIGQTLTFDRSALLYNDNMARRLTLEPVDEPAQPCHS